MKSVTVFCGAASGRDPAYTCMGAVADAALAAGGTVVGVIPGEFPREIAHTGLSTLHIVPDMHSRKALMAELGDAFVALPGGLGTAEELFEVLTWAQIRLHSKPCFLLDDSGYYRHLLAHLRHTAQEGFADSTDIAHLTVCRAPHEVVRQLRLMKGTAV
ncbi:TIGR00730 family Rossman fold protein [Streptomyces sp. NPDC004539]|uniref:LOG family protein n=1 Tax=Streptomyces sp. NPDC004539 TaxID=3154280 RepID=UPI00339F23BB